MLIAFWDAQGIHLLKFLGARATENVNWYCAVPWHLKKAIQMKHLLAR
jgi:hypothetical protein